jgi:hypothetical protein
MRSEAIAAGCLLATLMGGLAEAQVAKPRPKAARIEVTVERNEGGVWKSVEPSLVFSSGDLVRFRFKSNFSGYLYVTNYGTSGAAEKLFPRHDTGTENRVLRAQAYTVPATNTAFRIAGPPGYDSVYWLVSAVKLDGGPMSAMPAPPDAKPPVLIPRCDSVTLRARGLCLDPEAGPKQVTARDTVPDALEPLKGMTPRQLTVIQNQNQSVLSADGALAGPLLYEFRLAHN